MVKRIFTTVVFTFALPSMVYAAAYNMPAPGNDIVGEYYIVEANPGETLISIGANYDIGLHEMLEANPNISPQHVRAGQKVVIPTAYILPKFRQGIVINLAELRLYYFDNASNKVYTYPVGLGRREWRTPTAEAKISAKVNDPVWHVPESIADFVFEQTGRVLPEAMPPGPENPLGKHALYLTLNGYLIHGTNQPWSIGKLISSGCIRLHNADMDELFELAKVGDPVYIIHHPYKVGWKGGTLYLEAHVPVSIDDPLGKLNILSINQVLKEYLRDSNYRVDWHLVDRIIKHPNGIPNAVGARSV